MLRVVPCSVNQFSQLFDAGWFYWHLIVCDSLLAPASSEGSSNNHIRWRMTHSHLIQYHYRHHIPSSPVISPLFPWDPAPGRNESQDSWARETIFDFLSSLVSRNNLQLPLSPLKPIKYRARWEWDSIKGIFNSPLMLRPRYYDMSLPQTTGIRGRWTFLANTEAFRTAYQDEIEGTPQSLLFPRDHGELPVVKKTCSIALNLSRRRRQMKYARAVSVP